MRGLGMYLGLEKEAAPAAGAAPVYPEVKSLQKISVTLSGTTTNQTITAVDPSKTWVTHTMRVDSSDPGETLVRVHLTSATNVQMIKDDAAGPTVTVELQIIEFDQGVSVQRGVVDSVATETVAITEVDLTKAWAEVSWYNGGSVFGDDDFYRIKFNSSTELGVSHQFLTGVPDFYAWQVIEFDGAVVREVSQTVTTQGGATAPTDHTFDASRSIVRGSYSSESGTEANIGTKLLLLRFDTTDKSSVWFQRGNAEADLELTVFAIQFPPNVSVQEKRVNFTNAETQRVETITAVDLSKSIALGAGFMSCSGSCNYQGSDNPGCGIGTTVLTAVDKLTVQRQVTKSYPWYMVAHVVEWG